MLIILGIQCVLIGRFNVAEEASLSRVAKRFLGGLEGNSSSEFPESGGSLNGFRDIPNSPLAGGYGGRPGQTSAYGLSRFNDQRGGNDRFFPANNFNSNSGRMALANYSNPADSAGSTGPLRASVRSFKTEDWMPWSLIAAGAIVLIYTHSFERRSIE